MKCKELEGEKAGVHHSERLHLPDPQVWVIPRNRNGEREQVGIGQSGGGHQLMDIMDGNWSIFPYSEQPNKCSQMKRNRLLCYRHSTSNF